MMAEHKENRYKYSTKAASTLISPSGAEVRSVNAKSDVLHLFPHVVDRATVQQLQGISC